MLKKQIVKLGLVLFFIVSLSAFAGADTFKEDFSRAQKFESEGNLLKAKEIYSSLLKDENKKEIVMAAMDNLNIKMIFAGMPKEDFTVYKIKSGDNLVSIANRYGIPYEFIMTVNNIKAPQFIRISQELMIPKFAKELNIKVDIKKNVLTLFKGNERIKQYRVASGASESPTPLGDFSIFNRIEKPTWTLNGRNIPGGDPRNGLGTRWLGFKERRQYGIHGTNEPDSIGKNVSHGCIRMHNEDVEELFKIISIGTKVKIL